MSLLRKYRESTEKEGTRFVLIGEQDSSSELREYTAREIKDFLASDRLDAQTAEKVSRLLEKSNK